MPAIEVPQKGLKTQAYPSVAFSQRSRVGCIGWLKRSWMNTRWSVSHNQDFSQPMQTHYCNPPLRKAFLIYCLIPDAKCRWLEFEGSGMLYAPSDRMATERRAFPKVGIRMPIANRCKWKRSIRKGGRING